VDPRRRDAWHARITGTTDPEQRLTTAYDYLRAALKTATTDEAKRVRQRATDQIIAAADQAAREEP
jgi:hypothetical protein